MSTLKADDVRNAAQKHGWMDIHERLIGNRLDGRIFQKAPGRGRSVCPIHGTSKSNGRGDGFRFFKDAETSGGGVCNTCGKFADGFRLLMAIEGWTFPQTLEEVAKVVGLDVGSGRVRKDAPPPRVRPKVEAKPPNDTFIRNLLRRAWGEAVPVTDPLAAPLMRYLMRRKLSIEPIAGLKNFRFHPSLDYVDDDGVVVGQFPALLMGVSDALGRPATIHRTYLTENGEKAPVEEPKKVFPLPNDRSLVMPVEHPRFDGMMVDGGGFIRMGEPQAGVLGVAEGFETALAVHLATGMTVWPCVCADLMERFIPPEGVEQIVVWGDLDRSGRGREAAQRLKASAWDMGRKALVFMPSLSIPDDAKGVDWHDVWVMHGQAGFPRFRTEQRAVMPMAVGDAGPRYVDRDEGNLEPTYVQGPCPTPQSDGVRGLVAEPSMRSAAPWTGLLGRLRSFVKF